MILNIAIVEDEDLYANQLNTYLIQYRAERGCSMELKRFMDGDEIAEEYSGGYDIILMDIQMKFMDGMTAAEKIRQMDPDVIIIFITNMTEYAVRGYEVDALDYLVKPVEYVAFSRKMDRAVSRVRLKERNFITVITESGVKKLELEAIHYVEVQDHTLIYHTDREHVRAKGRGVLREAEHALAPYGFCRGNNCYLINLKWVEGVDGSQCMVGSAQVQLSRTKKKGFMDALVQYIGKGR